MKIHIVTPSYTGKPVPAYMNSVNAVMQTARDNGMEITATILPNCSILPLARSKLAAIALAGNADKIVFIDDDIGFRVDDFFTVIEADYDIVSLPYWCNETTLSYYATEMLPQYGQQFHDVISNGFGLMSIKRDVFNRMKKDCAKINEKEFRDVHGVKAESELHNYFSYNVVKGDFRGEDVSFCRLAGSYGLQHKMYCCGVTSHYKGEMALVLDFQRLVAHAGLIS